MILSRYLLVTGGYFLMITNNLQWIKLYKMIDLIRQSSPIDVILVWLLVYFLIHFMPLIHSTPPIPPTWWKPLVSTTWSTITVFQFINFNRYLAAEWKWYKGTCFHLGHYIKNENFKYRKLISFNIKWRSNGTKQLPKT